jgi:hypothetical protein
MYRIRLYIVPELDEDEREEFSSGFVDKDLLSGANGCWWDTVRGDGCVTVTHRPHTAKVKVTFNDSQQRRDQISGRSRDTRNNRVNTANKVRQSLDTLVYGCETWSLTLRERRRMRVFENRVLRRIFGPRRGEVAGDWRKLHNEELRDLYCSTNIVRVIKSRRMRWAGHVACMEERSCVQRFSGET